MRTLFLLILLLLGGILSAQDFTLSGRVTNTRHEPLALVSVEVRGTRIGAVTNTQGAFELKLEEGKYDIVISMIGFKPLLATVVMDRRDQVKQFILEEVSGTGLDEVVIKGRSRDRSEEYIRNVIRHKDDLLAAAGDYSCEIYIKAIRNDSATRKSKNDTVYRPNAALAAMSMTEALIKLDQKSNGAQREERTGLARRGNPDGLFYLSASEGDFNLYRNLIRSDGLSTVPFISPISYSGLLAYRYKLLRTEIVNGRKVHRISVRPRQLSNVTLEGELTILDSAWVLLETRMSFPKYHLPEYDFFTVEQQYDFVNDSAWMITKQVFQYGSKSNRTRRSGSTTAIYRNFELKKTFAPKHFGNEVVTTAQEAYERDSLFWNTVRAEPLSPKELRLIRYRDSIYEATHSKAYLDSVDRVINRFTWKKALFSGQQLNNHEKLRSWYLPPLASVFQPIGFGGSRIQLYGQYVKSYPNRKNIFVSAETSYGIRNGDVNGRILLSRLYNPFNRGMYSLHVNRNFEFIFSGDAWINMLKRSNIYLNNGFGGSHTLELANGLFFTTGAEIALRRSVAGYKTNDLVDSLLPDFLGPNRAVPFEGYNALYGQMRLSYTPFQRYMREPREKIILGSSWPTVYISLRKGVPRIFNSAVNFDYLEFGLEQEVKLGVMGTSKYTVLTGSFLNQRDLRLVDYKWQRRGDPVLFLNPNEAFQSLDSTFAVFRRFYQGHYVHDFNGALINKVPLLKKLGLREVGGAGFLIARERNLRYAEAFAGIERVFKWPFEINGKFKLGLYVVGSAANQFRNPVQLKFGIINWDRRKNKWQ